MNNLIIVGTKKPLHRRRSKKQTKFYDSFLDDDDYYNNIENYYKEFYGSLKFMDWPDMD